MDPLAAVGAIGPRTKALVAVHLFGHTADMASLLSVARAAGIPTIEDAAQAHGARYEGRPVGSLASAAAFSFYPTKNLGTVGDAGAVTTTERALAEQVRLLREYGWRTRADAEVLGVNARLDEVHAAMLRVMLTRFDDGTQRRRTIASAYLEGLADVSELELPTPRPKTESVWHLFVVRHPRRDAVAEALLRAGVGTGVHYDPPPHLTTAYRRFGWNAGDFPNAERHAATALSLPMHPFLTDSEVDRVIEAVRRACGAR
jgi:dTDP-4-amino-4,6-dideoxygalactose transaminase